MLRNNSLCNVQDKLLKINTITATDRNKRKFKSRKMYFLINSNLIKSPSVILHTVAFSWLATMKLISLVPTLFLPVNGFQPD